LVSDQTRDVSSLNLHRAVREACDQRQLDRANLDRICRRHARAKQYSRRHSSGFKKNAMGFLKLQLKNNNLTKKKKSQLIHVHGGNAHR